MNTIRPGRDDDRSACANLWMDAKAHQDNEEPDEFVHARAVRTIAQDPLVYWVVVDEADTVIGFVFVTDRRSVTNPTIPHAYVEFIAFEASMQGKGLGTQLFRELMQTLNGLDCVAGSLRVRDDNEPAQRLYAAFGWRLTGERFQNGAGQTDSLVYAIQFPVMAAD